MKTLRRLLVLLSFCVFLPSLPAQDGFRALRDSKGKVIEAKILEYSGGQIKVQMKNGRQYTFPLNILSEADQAAIVAEFDPTGGLPTHTLPKSQTGTFTEVWRVAAPIERLAFTPDAKYIIGSGTKTVMLEVTKGEKVWESDKGGQVGVGGKEPQIAVFNANGLHLLNPMTGETLKTIAPADGVKEVRDFEVSRTGNFVAFSGPAKKVYVHKLPGGEPAAAFDHGAGVESVAISPDGKQLAVSDYQEGLHFYDLTTLKKAGDFRGPATDRRLFKHLVYSPDGKTLGIHRATPGPSASVWLWDPATKKPVKELPSQVAGGNVAYSPTGQFVAARHALGGARTVIRVWETASGEEIASLGDENQTGGTIVAFSPDGKYLACACKDKGVDSAIVWSIQ